MKTWMVDNTVVGSEMASNTRLAWEQNLNLMIEKLA